ncbi:MAG TPA: DNA polymerase I [Stellaceae bacterium]|nr:DNA polymerase I [Stellaceae bacterium]
MSKTRHVYLVDGSGYIFRAYHALPPLTRPDGMPVGAVLGFTNMLLKLLRETDADHIAVVFDAARATFRNRIYEGYKAHRPEAPEDLVPQFALVRDATDACNVARIERSDYEADDLIAAYAKAAVKAGATVTIVSSDKDLMQLVNDQVQMFDPMKERPIGAAEVREKFGVGPEQVIDVQALCGDSVDNVPGVPGIGVKTAAELIGQYGTLENLLEHAPEIKQPKRRQNLIEFAEQARISKRLVTLDTDAPLPLPLDDLAVRPLDAAKLGPFLQSQGFRALINRYGELLKGAPGNAAATAAPKPAPASPAAPKPRAGNGAMAVAMPEGLASAAQKYELAQDQATLERWIARAAAQGSLAIDIETTSRDPMRAELVGIALALAPGEACYVPLAHRRESAGSDLGPLASAAAEPLRQVPRDLALARLKPLLEDPAVLKIGHDIKQNVLLLRRHGVALAPIDDTLLQSFVLDGGRHGHDLDELAELNFGRKTIAYKDLVGSGKSEIEFAAVPLDRARDYAAEDADMTLRCHRLFRPRLVAEHRLAFYERIERPLVPVVAAMEREGILVDRRRLKELSEDFAQRMTELESEIHKLAGYPFNLGSPKQLGEVLFEKLQLPGGKKMKTGAYGTDAAVLDELAELHPLPQRVLDWRQLQKLKSTYADTLVDEINPETGRIHTRYSLTGAVTGRLSSNDPNLQNIPIRTEEGRKIRRAFVAAPGHRLLSADYSQIELRLAAHVADIEPLKAAFRSGIDIHAMTASEVFGVPLDKMDGATRRRAKAINFGIIYGISAFGLARQLQIPQGEASAYIKAYFERFPGIRAYMERMKQQCREQGYVETLFGRRCWIPGIKDGNAARRSFAERQAINAPLQGSAADIIKRAMARVSPALERAGLKGRMLLQVHDELVFEVPEAEVEKTAAVVKETMEGAMAPRHSLSVPLVVETGSAQNWDDAH